MGACALPRPTLPSPPGHLGSAALRRAQSILTCVAGRGEHLGGSQAVNLHPHQCLQKFIRIKGSKRVPRTAWHRMECFRAGGEALSCPRTERGRQEGTGAAAALGAGFAGAFYFLFVFPLRTRI